MNYNAIAEKTDKWCVTSAWRSDTTTYDSTTYRNNLKFPDDDGTFYSWACIEDEQTDPYAD